MDGSAVAPGTDTGATPVGGDGGAMPPGSDAGGMSTGSDAGSDGGSDAQASSEAGPGPEGGTGMVACGTTPAALDITKIGKIEQLVVAPDGTIYFSTSPFGAALGRYAPPYATVDLPWRTVPDANAQILGIALDPKINMIYAGARITSKLYKIPLDNSPITSVTLPDAQFNGATLGEDGAVYYTNEMASGTTANVYRIGPTDTAPQKVNTTPLVHGNDLAFGPDGWLYVNQWVSPATVTRLKLQNGLESAREVFVTLSVTGTPAGFGDGIAFDAAGNFYALAGALYKVTPSKAITVIPTSAAPTSGMEFGCGTLSCNDLLFATSAGVSKMTVMDPGMNVPWHRR